MSMPNDFNIFFDMFYIALPMMCLYAPGLPYLYHYMLKQRSKVLGKSKKA